jgi:hypothetical protein
VLSDAADQPDVAADDGLPPFGRSVAPSQLNVKLARQA